MKQKLLSIIIGGIMLAIMITPTVNAASTAFTWSFDMNYYAVYGDDHGIYYDLPAGDITVTGDIWADVEGSSPSPNAVDCELWKDTFGPDTLVASKYDYPSSTLYGDSYFTIIVNGQPSDQYYLRFEKQALIDNGWDLQGTGTIKSVY